MLPLYDKRDADIMPLPRRAPRERDISLQATPILIHGLPLPLLLACLHMRYAAPDIGERFAMPATPLLPYAIRATPLIRCCFRR